ncbi:uncharacterized protein EDB91DRAFT_1130436, partial [Suillus paluster]|uniref:uncharacterized protein n=1 Tax=Suillus paluster TaxID=48578 RepID=UPI001B86AEDC
IYSGHRLGCICFLGLRYRTFLLANFCCIASGSSSRPFSLFSVPLRRKLVATVQPLTPRHVRCIMSFVAPSC